MTDLGDLNDRGFNALANQGLERAEAELGVEGRVVSPDVPGRDGLIDELDAVAERIKAGQIEIPRE